MNKTVNINLAGLFFHIDENAYAKLQRYLDAIKRSFTDSQGRDEIIQDIEARIAELFSERIKSERQVIGLKEVDDVIEIMGQPEDYHLNEEIFEDEPRVTIDRSPKKLYRDTENSYLGGVSSGLGHYLGIDAIWIRLLWIFLTLFSGGGFILIYIAFWIFVPEAVTTAEKLEMRGKPVNIDNIQRKVKEGFDNVADTVKSVDYEKYGSKARKGANSFANKLGKVIMFILTAFVKLLGIMLILIGGISVIAMFIGLFTAGTIGVVDGNFGEYVNLVNTTGAPLWLISLMVFFAAGIPFFALFYLGLKILVSNLRSMSLTAKMTILAIWLISIIGLSVLGIKQAMAVSVDGEVTTTEVLPIALTDTLTVRMTGHERYGNNLYRSGDWQIKSDTDGQKVLYSRDIRLVVKQSDDDKARLTVEKHSQGSGFDEAREKAENITYGFDLKGNVLELNGYFLTDPADQYRDQEVKLTLYIPEGMTLYAADNTSSYHLNSSSYGDLLDKGYEKQYLLMQNGDLVCTSCPPDFNKEQEEGDWEYREYQGEDTGTTYDYDASLKPSQTNSDSAPARRDTVSKTTDTVN